MFAKHLKDLIIKENELLSDALWKLTVLGAGESRLIVVDENEKYFGIICLDDIKANNRIGQNFKELAVRDVCNRNAHFIRNDNVQLYGRDFFANHINIHHLTVLDDENNVVDIYTRKQAFYRNYYEERVLPYQKYAYCIWEAAKLAKTLGYSEISVLEFGVATGNGLLNIEFHVTEIEKIFGVNIQVYGFDTAAGLPKAKDTRDEPFKWREGYFKMDIENLSGKLRRSELVIGDLKDTGSTFFNKYSPAPIGVMLIDVDYYSSTVPILNMLYDEDKFFLPRIFMYFDDIAGYADYVGENLAVKEFNERSKNVKISSFYHYGLRASAEYALKKQGIKLSSFHYSEVYQNCVIPETRHFMCHRFDHKHYTASCISEDEWQGDVQSIIGLPKSRE